MSKKPQWLGGRFPALLLLALGGVATWFAFSTLRSIETQNVTLQFQQLAGQRVAAIKRRLEQEMLVLESVRGLYKASREVERSEFREFLQPYLASPLGAQSFAWVPRITAARRTEFEAALQADKVARSIVVIDDRTMLVAAPLQPLYFPVEYLEPPTDRSLIPGLDLIASPVFAGVLERTEPSTAVQVSGSFAPLRGDAAGNRVLFTVPVFGKADDATDAPDVLQGFVAASLDLSRFIDHAISILVPAGIDLRLYDASAADGSGFLAVYGSRLRDRDNPVSTSDGDIFAGHLQHEVTMPVADRQWVLRMTPVPGFFETGISVRSWGVLAAGLLLTLALFAYLESVRIRDRRLQQTNEKLNREIANRKQAQIRLTKARDFYLTLLDDLPSLIWRSDTAGQYDYFNKAWQRFTGRGLHEEVGDGWARGMHPEDLGEFRKLFSTALRNRTPFEYEYRLAHHSGDYRWVRVEAKPYTNLEGDFAGFIGSCLDVSQHMIAEKGLKQANEELQRLSMQDGLTGIANRRSFDQYIEREWVRAARCADRLSLIILDLDHFKEFNDHYGHIEGDQCLRRVAAALHQVFERPADMVARYGGEEIAVVLPNTDADGLRAKAEQVMEAMHALGIEHEKSGVSDQLTVSLGIGTIVPHAKVPVRAFIESVDKALYRAKRAGRNRIEVAENISLEDLLKASV